MTLIYRTAGAWGAGKGVNLTPAEVDGNFYDHEGRIVSLEDSAALGTQIDYFSITGYDLYVHMTDHSVLGPYTLPSTPTWTFTGAWQPTTAYEINDVFTALGKVYLVVYAHTSASSFDPGANTAGHDYYAVLMSLPATPVSTITGSSITLDSTYANNYMRCTNAAGCSVTLSAGVFAVTTELHFRVANDVGVTLIADTGVTFDIPSGFLAECSTHGGVLTAKQYDTDAWDIFGLLDSV